MITPAPHLVGTDPETPISVLRRFSIVTLEQSLEDFTVRASMPVAGMTNPLTGLPSMAALAILVDDVAGRVNYYRCGRPTVSSELTVELCPGAAETLAAAPDTPVVATAHPVGSAGSPLLSACTLTHRDRVIGTGTVHTVALPGAGAAGPRDPGSDLPGRHPDPVAGSTDLAALMAVDPLAATDGAVRLHQRPDPMVNNMIGIVHGGVSSAGLELVGSAAINRGQDRPFHTASIRVNFLRPFLASGEPGAESVYAGTALRLGRTSAVGDATAIGADGRAAVIARVTGYR